MTQQFNDGLTETEDVSLLDISEHGATLKIKGEDYDLRQLTLDDYARCEKYIRQRRIEAVQDSALNAEMQAEVIYRVVCQSVTQREIWMEYSGEIMMLARAFVDGVKIKEGDGLEFVKSLPPVSREVVSRVLYKICGLKHPLGTERGQEISAAPSLPDLTPDLNNGTEASEPSAVTTE